MGMSLEDLQRSEAFGGTRGRRGGVSFLPGFIGHRLTLAPKDEDLAFAAMRADNDWHLEAWCGVGVENILVESDYPHADSTWPTTQATLERHVRGIPHDEVRRVCWQNAVELFRMPTPPHTLP